MASKWITTLVMASAVTACATVSFASVAEARHRHYGWHSGWHKDWHTHRGVRYGYARPVTYAYGGYMGAPAYGCQTPGYYGAATGYDDYAGGGLFGLGLGPF